MTCIAAFRHNDTIWIAGDSIGVSDYGIKIVRNDSKIFGVGDEFLFGCTTSYRMIQILQFKLKIPENTRASDFEFMCTDFVDAIRTALKDNHYTKVKDNVEEGGTFIVGYRGEIYVIHPDFQVEMPTACYSAVGSGREFALASMYEQIRQNAYDMIDGGAFVKGDTVVLNAVSCSRHFSTTVGGPIRVEVLKWKSNPTTNTLTISSSISVTTPTTP